MYVECERCGQKEYQVEENRGQGVIQIGKSGMDVRKGGRQKQCTPERERHSRTAHGQEPWKAQQKRKIDRGRSDKPSKC